MQFIRCFSCFFLNPAGSVECKGCGKALGQPAQAAKQTPQPVQQPIERSKAVPVVRAPVRPTVDYSNPPPPPVFHGDRPNSVLLQMPPPPATFSRQSITQQQFKCIKCGSTRLISIQTFIKTYANLWACLGFLAVFIPLFIFVLVSDFRPKRILFLPLLILILVLPVNHKITAPFCQKCWENFKSGQTVGVVASLGCVGALLIGIIAGIFTESFVLLGILIPIVIIIAIWSLRYMRRNSLKFLKVDRKRVIILSALDGEICFEK